MGATVRINVPHMKTKSLPSSISASALWMRLLTPSVLCLVLLCVMLCWHIGWEMCRRSLCPGLCLGPVASAVVAVPGWNLCHRLTALEWRGERNWGRYAGGVGNRPPAFLLLPLPSHMLSQDWTLRSLRGPNRALIRIWWRNSTPQAAEILTRLIPNWTFWLSWQASKGWMLQRLWQCRP